MTNPEQDVDGLEGQDPTIRADYESTPLTRSQYISAIVHLYRGELYRANAWRLRLDNTTNWSVLASGGLITFTFGAAQNTHWVLVLGMALVGMFWIIEARRFRLYYVWRARVRMIEENFYGPILRRDPVSPESDWGSLVARDLLEPRYKIGRVAALRARLTRNYWAIFSVLFLAWLIKVTIHPFPARSLADFRANLGESIVFPWWTTVGFVSSLFFALVVIALFGSREGRSGDNDYWDGSRNPLSSND